MDEEIFLIFGFDSGMILSVDVFYRIGTISIIKIARYGYFGSFFYEKRRMLTCSFSWC